MDLKRYYFDVLSKYNFSNLKKIGKTYHRFCNTESSAFASLTNTLIYVSEERIQIW